MFYMLLGHAPQLYIFFASLTVAVCSSFLFRPPTMLSGRAWLVVTICFFRVVKRRYRYILSLVVRLVIVGGAMSLIADQVRV